MAGDVKVAVVSGKLSSSGTGFVDLKKTGFGTVKSCIVLVGLDLDDGTGVAVQSRISIGLSDLTNNYCISHQDEDASAKVDCDAIKSNTKAYISIETSGSISFEGTAGSVTDGVRLTNASMGVSPPFATVIMFGGADLAVDLRLIPA